MKVSQCKVCIMKEENFMNCVVKVNDLVIGFILVGVNIGFFVDVNSIKFWFFFFCYLLKFLEKRVVCQGDLLWMVMKVGKIY